MGAACCFGSGGQHRGQRRPQTGRGVCRDVTTRGIPGGGGARSRAAAPRDPGNWSSTTRARPPQHCPWTRSPPGPRGPEPRPAGERGWRHPFPRAGLSAPRCWILGQRRPRPAALNPVLGGGGGAEGEDVTLFSPLTKCGVPQDPWPFVRFSRRVQISWEGVKRPQGSFRLQSWVASRKLAEEACRPPPILYIPWSGEEPAWYPSWERGLPRAALKLRRSQGCAR